MRRTQIQKINLTNDTFARRSGTTGDGHCLQESCRSRDQPVLLLEANMSARDEITDGSGHPSGRGGGGRARPRGRCLWDYRGGRLAAARPPVAEAAAAYSPGGGRGRRAPLAGGRRPPNSETGHVDSPGRCPRAQIVLKLVHTGIAITHRPRSKERAVAA
jgi:hypothetical protein